MKPFWLSKKWWFTVLAVLVPILNQTFGLGLDATTVLEIILPIMVYVGGQAHIDAKKIDANAKNAMSIYKVS